MPGRLFLTATVSELAGLFGADAAAIAEPPLPEVAPGDTVLALLADPGRRLAAMRWGLIPMGRTNARGRPVVETIVNARSETLFTKSAYAGLRRALLPASGWYEWTGEPRRRKIRWTIRAPSVPVMAFAAVWDLWRAPGGVEVASLATVTCAPNRDVAPVHDRMPVILGPEAWPPWLGEAAGDPMALMTPLPEGVLVVEPG